MAKNKRMIKLSIARIAEKTRFKPLSCVGLLCSIALLSGCGDSTSRLPAFETKSQVTESIEKSTSHIETQKVEETKKTAKKQFTTKTPEKIPPKKITRSNLNPKNMFGVDLRSDEERLDRLERAVQKMRHEFDTVTPSIRRLMAVEGDIQELIVELQKLSADPSIATPAPRQHPTRQKSARTPQVTSMLQSLRPIPTGKMKAVAKPRKTNQTKTAPAVQNGRANIYDIRIGEHPGKTRIVLDVNTKTSFKTDLDNAEKIMIVDIPKAEWSAATSKNFGKSSFISSYKVESSDGGQLLIFQLKRSARISYQSDIGGQNGSRRIVIDLSAG